MAIMLAKMMMFIIDNVGDHDKRLSCLLSTMSAIMIKDDDVYYRQCWRS